MIKNAESILQTYLFMVKKVENDKSIKKADKTIIYCGMSTAYKAIVTESAIAFRNQYVPRILALEKKSELLVKAITGTFSGEAQDAL